MKKLLCLYVCLFSTIYTKEEGKKDVTQAIEVYNPSANLEKFNSFHELVISYWNEQAPTKDADSKDAQEALSTPHVPFKATQGAILTLQGVSAGATLSLLFPSLGKGVMKLAVLAHAAATTKPAADHFLQKKLPATWHPYIPVATTVIVFGVGGRLFSL